jgi:hypothetical protein
MYGRFSGTETLRGERNPALNQAIVQGVTLSIAPLIDGVTIDGVTFRNIGVCNLYKTTLRNCVFEAN